MKSRAETIRDALREDIVEGKCAPGQALQEEEIASEFKVSRTPIREALRILEFEGLVKVVPKRGTFVREVTARDVKEIFEIRAAFEGFAVRAFGDKIDRDKLCELRDTLKRMRVDKAFAEAQHARVDSDLHQAIIGAVNNRRVAEMFERHAVQTARLRAISWTVSERWFEAVAEHATIVDLLLAHDWEAAETALVDHFAHGRKNIDSVLAEQGA